MSSIRHHSLTALLLALLPISQAWVNLAASRTTARAFASQQRPAPTLLFSTTKTDSDDVSSSNSSAAATAPVLAKEEAKQDEDEGEEDDDDDEYEYLEYETLTEDDYLGSEWMVGTLWENNPNDIKETWVRLAFKQDKNIAVWGDDAEGTWSFDPASQFLAISKQYLWGKQIWAGVVDDYYFSQGTVRGWTYLTAASVLGQWQAKRLGVDTDEAGTAPWFEEDEEEEEEGGEITAADDNSDNN